MSSPRRRKPRNTALSRRDFLRRAVWGSAAVGTLPLLPGCGASDDPGGRGPGTGAAEFRHGVASGDPLSDRVMLWTRVSGIAAGSVSVDYQVWSDPALTQAVTAGTTSADASRDYTVKVDVAGLQPGTSYYYRFNSGGAESPVGRTRTAPQGAVDRLRIGVVSCSSLAHGFFNAYRLLAARADLDLILHLGDYIYEYGNGEYGSARQYEPPHEILTLDDYRTRYSQYRLDPDLQELHRQHPMINVWDDHETADNSWRDGAENHQPGEGEWAQRKAWGIQAFHEWLPIRPTDPADPGRIYRSFRYGDLADITMLDTRLHDRDEPGSIPPLPNEPIRDPARRMLGPEQRQWLFDRLSTSTTRWRLIGQQVVMHQWQLVGLPLALGGGLPLNGDAWDGYQAERQAFIDHLRDRAIDNVLILTGDVHSSWAADLTDDPANPLAYNPLTGAGAVAAEFVTTSVTSPFLLDLPDGQQAFQLTNPHIKYIDLDRKGYLLLDVTAERIQGEWWYVDTFAERGGGESFGRALQLMDGANHLSPALTAGSPSTPATGSPPPAP
jgi:alkaline phosphatase D